MAKPTKTMLRNFKLHAPKEHPGLTPFTTTRKFRGLPYGETVYAESEAQVKRSIPGLRIDGVLVAEKDIR